MAELQLQPATLAEMISLIENGTISGKIGKQILPALLQVTLYPSSIPVPVPTPAQRQLYPCFIPIFCICVCGYGS